MKMLGWLPSWIVDCIKGKTVREIRLRNNAVVRVNVDGRWWYCSHSGLKGSQTDGDLLDVSCNDLVRVACNNSIYAYEQMLAEGYFTLADGSRLGVAGQYGSGGKIFKEYTSICVRIPHCIACADSRLVSVVQQSSTLIFGAPASGKTTLLRDIAGQLSKDYNVVVVDERGELDVGDALVECDVLKWTSKDVGVEMSLRCLSPNYIFCDELSQRDLTWLARATSSGVKIIATLHASNLALAKEFLGKNIIFGGMIFCKDVGQYSVVNLKG